jgi:hypothetical protein
VVNCPNGHKAKVAKQRVMGLKLYFCPECSTKAIENHMRWVQCGPGHEEQLLGFAERVSSDRGRLKEFMEADSDSPWFSRTEIYP